MAVTSRTTFDGMSLAEAKRVTDYDFAGQIINLKKNEKTQTYELCLKSTVSKNLVERFKKYHKNRFKIEVYKLEYEM